LADRVQAWKYGPVIPSVYRAFKKYGLDEITENAIDVTPQGRPYVPSIRRDDLEASDLLNEVWNVYKPYTGVQLSNLTHLKNTPWDRTWKQVGGRKSVEIPDQTIRDFYQQLRVSPEQAGL
jgi:uncharacterized phage-associated protein